MVRVRFHADDLGGTHTAGDQDREQANRTASQYGDGLATQILDLTCVNRIAKWLLHSTNFRTNPIEIRWPQGFGRKLAALGKATVPRDPNDLVPGTNV